MITCHQFQPVIRVTSREDRQSVPTNRCIDCGEYSTCHESELQHYYGTHVPPGDREALELFASNSVQQDRRRTGLHALDDWEARQEHVRVVQARIDAYRLEQREARRQSMQDSYCAARSPAQHDECTRFVGHSGSHRNEAGDRWTEIRIEPETFDFVGRGDTYLPPFTMTRT